MKPSVLVMQQKLNASGRGYDLKEDGIYGPRTAAAYRDYLARMESDVPLVPPAPDKPWYLSRALVGLLASFIAIGANRLGWTLDATQLVQVLVSAVEVGGLALAFWGTVTRRAAIDPTLVARVGGRDVRLPVPAEREIDPEDPRGLFRDS